MARPLCLHRGDRWWLQPDSRGDRRRPAAGRDRQLRRRLPLVAIPHGAAAVDPHRRDPVPAARPARPGRRPHHMRSGRSVLAAAVLTLAAVLLLAAAFPFRPYGIVSLTMWSVTALARSSLHATL